MPAAAHPHVQIIVGSVREGRTSGPVARWVAKRFEAMFGRPAEIVDLRDWSLPDFNLSAPPAMGTYPDRRQRAWATTIARADAFVFVTPEYNHGYSAALKNAFDWVYAEWAGKPATFVSFGNANGSRAVQQVKQVMGELRMVPIEPTVALKPHGRIEDRQLSENEDDDRRLSRSLEELLRWEEALRLLRAPATRAPWTDRRVLVVGLDPPTNRSVVAPLVAAGMDAHGFVVNAGGTLPDGDGYDLIAIGRGAAGKVADAIKHAVRTNDASKPVLEVVGPVAVRQILAACDPDAPRLVAEHVELSGRRLALGFAGDDGHLGVTALEQVASGLVPHRIAEGELRGDMRLTTNLAFDPYSIVIDLDGAAFHHIPVL